MSRTAPCGEGSEFTDPFTFKAQSVFLPVGLAHPSDTGFLRHHQNPQAEQITSSYHLSLPGERPSVREKMESRTIELISTLGKPVPTPCAETQTLAQKPSVLWEILAEGYWWDTECSEPHMAVLKVRTPWKREINGGKQNTKRTHGGLFHFTNILRTFKNAVSGQLCE